MRPLVVYGAISLVLLLAGAGLRGWGHLRHRGIDAHRQLLAMGYGGLSSQYDALQQSTPAYAKRLPWVERLQASVAAQRAESRYWQGDYNALMPARDASGAVVEQDPGLMLLAANAAYRRINLDAIERDTVERLQAVVGQYGDVLKRDPSLIDAAYNYEFTARTRDLLARLRGAQLKGQKVLPRPPAQTIHGRVGAPPVRTDMNKFKIVIPERPDERNLAPQSGTGGLKSRKG